MTLIKEIVNNIPYLLTYYVPGFCTVFAYRRFRAANLSAMSETVHLGTCVVISYLINSLLEMICPITENAALEGDVFRCFWATIIGVLFAFALVKLRGCRKVRQLYADKLNNSLADTVFEASELAGDVYVTVYGEKKKVSGRVVLFGDEKDPWIALDYYQAFEEGKGRIDVWHNYKTYTRYIIPFSEIKAIVVQYKMNDRTYTTERFLELQKQKVDNPMKRRIFEN